MDGRALFSTSTKDGGSQSQKATSPTIAKPPPSLPDGQVADVKILRTLASYLWMKDNLEFRVRVVAALGLLVGAKVSYLVACGSWFYANANLLMVIGDPCFFVGTLCSGFECSGPVHVQACS